MVDYMKVVAKLNVELTVEERNLLSVAYKNVVGARRASWRIITSIEQKEESKGSSAHLQRIKEYRARVEKVRLAETKKRRKKRPLKVVILLLVSRRHYLNSSRTNTDLLLIFSLI